jgi:hypothetical protein
MTSKLEKMRLKQAKEREQYELSQAYEKALREKGSKLDR